MSQLCLLILAASCMVLCSGHGEVNPCEGEFEDLQSCLSHIRHTALDTHRFWFGDDYTERCMNSTSVECYNPLGYSGRDIVSLMFSEGESALDDLDRFLYVHYQSQEIQYHGCGTYVEQPATSFDLDMSLEEHLPATTRDKPARLWWDHEEGERFIVMLVDPGFGFMHGLHVDVLENDGSTGNMIIEYAGPGNIRFTPNPYIWLVFKQSYGPIELTQEWMNKLADMSFVQSLSEFKEAFGLVGPVAMNIMLVSTDIYAVERIQTGYPGALQHCSAFVGKGLKKQEETFLPDDVMLQAYLNVTIESQDFEFFYCCERHEYDGRSTVLDPLSYHLVKAADVRTGSKVHFSLNATGVPPTINIFQDKHYVMMAVDPDVPFAHVGTTSRPLIHYFAYNLEVTPTGQFTGTVMSGEEEHYYRGPAPPDDLPHTYYFLMYEQQAWWGQPDADLGQYTSAQDCPEGLLGRCLFDVERYTDDKHLKLIAASWMHARNDDYVNFFYDAEEAEVCGNRFPCPTPGGASGLKMSIRGFLGMFFYVIIYIWI